MNTPDANSTSADPNPKVTTEHNSTEGIEAKHRRGSRNPERRRSLLAAGATYDAYIADGLRDDQPLARARIEREHARGLYEAVIASGGVHRAADHAERADRAYEDAVAVPNSVRKFTERWIPPVVKAALILGDATVLGTIWWRTGQSLWLSLLAGLSAGIIMVMVGSITGREAQIAVQRKKRGRRPDHYPKSLADLYVGDGISRPWWWITICVVVGISVMAAITMIGLAVGDRPGLALGAGIFAAMTLIGSAAVEAYGTNPAADLIKQRARDRDDSLFALKEIDQLKAQMASAHEKAHVLEQRLKSGASAAAQARLEADRTYRDAERWGNTASGSPERTSDHLGYPKMSPDLPPLPQLVFEPSRALDEIEDGRVDNGVLPRGD